MKGAFSEQLIRHNPADRVPMPHRPRIDDDEEGGGKALTREQAAMLLRMTPERHRLMLRFILASALRIGEVVGLHWKHVRLDGSSPHVRVRRTYSKGELGPPKSKYGRREVPISEDLRDALRAHRKVSEWPGDDDLVFPSQTGTYLRADNLRSRMLKPIMQEIGAPWAGFHSLRHTASMLFERGTNVKKVQRWLGQHSPAFTLNSYVHLLSDELDTPLDLDVEVAGDGVATKVATDPRQTAPDGWVATAAESAV